MGRCLQAAAAAVLAGLCAGVAHAATKWVSGADVDKMSGVKTTLITTPAVLPPSFNGRQLRPRLTIQCTPKKPMELFADLDFPVSRSSKGAARIKFDDQAPKSITGTYSVDGKSLFLPNAAGVVQGLLKAKEFRVEVTAATQQQIILAFLVEGLADQRDALTACGVKLPK
jgi:hypothetical protein